MSSKDPLIYLKHIRDCCERIATYVSESGPAEVASDPGGGSTLLQSLRNLGLDLAERKMPVVKLIIDHVERTPTEN